jgi:ERCC4-type nuclease
MLAHSQYQSVLILEGTGKDFKNCNISRQSETVQLMIYTAGQLNRFSTGLVQRPGYYPKSKTKRQMFILQGLPGIGKKRAKILIERFESINAVINASRKELTALDGIGNNTADEIIYMVNEQNPCYNSDSDDFADI